jgi:VanZ family protein
MKHFYSLLIFNARYQKASLCAAFALYFAVLILGSLPGARAEVGAYASGLFLHAMTYAVITIFLFNGLTGDAWRKSIGAFLTVATMGGGDEWIQSFFPYRTASVGDWLVDVGAALLACVILGLLWPKRAGNATELKMP